MDLNNGYIYIRRHIYYENDKICKLGKSKNIPDRDNGYATGEYRRGKFGLVIEISKIKYLMIHMSKNYYKDILKFITLKWMAVVNFIKIK